MSKSTTPRSTRREVRPLAPPKASAHRLAYRSEILDGLRAGGGLLSVGRLTIRCSTHFGFCWGVDRALEIVFRTIADNPDRRIWLLNQIIHNPTVNQDLVHRGVRFIQGPMAGETGFDEVGRDDIVVIPAFSAQLENLARLREIGCEIVDTTCAWVLKPHDRTKRNIRAGFTSVVHGYLDHDETRATVSLIRSEGGRHVIVAGLQEAELLCAAISGDRPAEHLSRLPAGAVSEPFDPQEHLRRIGLLNQTTMLASESRAIGDRIREAMRSRWGAADLDDRFHDFDTICRATQENQDAVEHLISSGPLDLLIVVGGYDSSNTHNLVRLGLRSGIPTFHIQDPATISRTTIGYRCPQTGRQLHANGWLPPGQVRVGFTAGASTPDIVLAEAIARVGEAAGIERHRFASARPGERVGDRGSDPEH